MRFQPSLRRYLFPSIALADGILLILIMIVVFIVLDSQATEAIRQTIESYSMLLEGMVLNLDSPPSERTVFEAPPLAEEQPGIHFSIIAKSGEVVWDSVAEAFDSWRIPLPEAVRRALEGERQLIRDYDPFLGGEALVVLRPVIQDNQVIAVVRCAHVIPTVGDFLHPFELIIFALFFIAFLAASLTTLWAARRVATPLNDLKEVLNRHGTDVTEIGEQPTYVREFSDLFATIRKIIFDLHDRLTLAVTQRNELDAVLSGMVEAVLVVDRDESLVRYNQAAEALFGFPARFRTGMSIQEAIRNAEFHRFTRRTLLSRNAVEGEITIRSKPLQHLHAYGVSLYDERDRMFGCLIVLHDITRLRQLETTRQEFIANVSHELKTPITAIKGFVETLRDGALEDTGTARKFLDIISKQSDHLHRLIEDLLALSRLEQQSEKGDMALSEHSVADLIESSIAICQRKADEKETVISVEGSPGLSVKINLDLMQQALVNLIDNAIKYSPPKGSVIISCAQTPAALSINVTDSGCGIHPDVQGLIFERFYRVKDNPNRGEEGSGLGLPIAKHIVNVHGGSLTVTSTPNQGSVFTITLPT